MKVLLVAPYPDMKAEAQPLLKEFPGLLTIATGNLREGLQIARETTSNEHIGAVVSRGATADLLRQNLSIPVYDIETSILDLLRAMSPLLMSCQKIAIVAHPTVIGPASLIPDILGIQIGYFPVGSPDEAGANLKSAVEWEADAILGDTAAVDVARSHGLTIELIASSLETIRDATEKAVNRLRMDGERQRWERHLRTMVEYLDQGVLILDRDRKISLANRQAEELFHIPKQRLIGTEFADPAMPSALVTAVKNRTNSGSIRLHGELVDVNVVPMDVDSPLLETVVFLRGKRDRKSKPQVHHMKANRNGLSATWTFDEIIAVDPAFKKIVELAKNCSAVESTVLILGESGVGKEVIAQSIHNASPRKNGPFVGVNCAALAETLLESELFGYVEGAFTGARKGGKPGYFEIANNGTIFLDEVNDMSTLLQVRLLRVLQERKVMRLGDDQVHEVNVRLIAASNKNLFEETQSGRFRQDLYYRLKVFDFYIPPLRERKNDILPLFETSIEHFTKIHNFLPVKLPSKLLDAVVNYSWPGNVRQLYNFAEKVTVLFSAGRNRQEVTDDLVNELQEQCSGTQTTHTKHVKKTLKEMQTNFIHDCWERNGHNISKTAREIGVNRVTIRKYLTPNAGSH
jgi:transcriptional regulator with PAS, ATPase and Fis domain